MRIKMKKFLFVGTHKAHEQFFERAQAEGKLEFITLSGKKEHHLPKHVHDLQRAINLLKRLQVAHKPDQVEREQAQNLVENILETKRQIENYHEEIRITKAEIIKMAPLGEFNVENLNQLSLETGRHCQFFFCRHERFKKEEIPTDLIYINREFDFDYYMYLGEEKFSHPLMGEIEVTESLSTVKKKKHDLEILSAAKEIEMKGYAKYFHFLHDVLIEEMNAIHLNFAKEDIDSHLDQKLFVIEAWIPKNKIDCIESLIIGMPIHVEEVKIEEGDKIPTYLENKNISAVGQDLVEIYDTPSTSDRDPSTWVIWSFALFFGMIVADACYGMLFFLLSLFFWYKFRGAKGGKRRALKLFTIISSASIIWGVMVGSYFSIKMEPNNPINRISLLYNLAYNKVDYCIQMKNETYSQWIKEYPNLAGIKDPAKFIQNGTEKKGGRILYALMEELYDSLLLEIAILVGIIHICLSFLRNLYRSWSGVGWITTMWGGYFFFPKMLGGVTLVQYMGLMSSQTAWHIGEYMLYGGISLAVILALIQEKWVGLIALFKVIEVFADTLSYLRLYALGLASMVMAATFNDLGLSSGNFFLGAIIILLGHSVNITLAVMAGVIHGLRLNFLEWYHHSFEGGGNKFNPLKLLVKE